MKATVICTSSVATESHRGQQQEIDIEMDDTVASIKIKVTLVYAQLDPEDICLTLNHRKLGENQKVIDLVKMNGGNKLVFGVTSSSSDCCLLF